MRVPAIMSLPQGLMTLNSDKFCICRFSKLAKELKVVLPGRRSYVSSQRYCTAKFEALSSMSLLPYIGEVCCFKTGLPFA